MSHSYWHGGQIEHLAQASLLHDPLPGEPEIKGAGGTRTSMRRFGTGPTSITLTALHASHSTMLIELAPALAEFAYLPPGLNVRQFGASPTETVLSNL